MAKYCSKCGKLLEKNQKCDCQAKVKKVRESKIDYKKYLDEFIDIYKYIFTKPIDTIKNYTNNICYYTNKENGYIKANKIFFLLISSLQRQYNTPFSISAPKVNFFGSAP